MKRDRYKELEDRFKEAVELFGDGLAFSCFTGTYSYGAHKNNSDVDLLVVLKDQESNKRLLELRREFTRRYKEIHKEFGFNPDNKFPGEVISLEMLKDSFLGRGFDTNGEKVYLEEIIIEDQWDDPEKEYRCWLSMSAFNNRQLILGDKLEFDRSRVLANFKIAKFLLYSSGIHMLKSDKDLASLIERKILEGRKPFLGIKVPEEVFQKDYRQVFPEVYKELLVKGIITKNGCLEINLPALNEEYSRIANMLTKKVYKSKALFNWEEIR